MKVFSDTLTVNDFYAALPAGVGIYSVEERGTRLREHGWDIYLEGLTDKHTRATNSGTHGAGSYKSASYDDHGYWMSRLFDKDPDAIISTWRGLDQFIEGTEGRYEVDAV